jgi:hypothetical protein
MSARERVAKIRAWLNADVPRSDYGTAGMQADELQAEHDARRAGREAAYRAIDTATL